MRNENDKMITNLKDIMKRMNMKTYEAPEIEVVEVAVEKGFSVSLGYTDKWADSSYDIE